MFWLFKETIYTHPWLARFKSTTWDRLTKSAYFWGNFHKILFHIMFIKMLQKNVLLMDLTSSYAFASTERFRVVPLVTFVLNLLHVVNFT